MSRFKGKRVWDSRRCVTVDGIRDSLTSREVLWSALTVMNAGNAVNYDVHVREINE